MFGEQETTQRLKDAYLDKELDMSWNPGQHETLAMEAPFVCVTLQAHDFEENIDIIADKNGKAAIYVEGRFFRLEKIVDGAEEIRIWE